MCAIRTATLKLLILNILLLVIFLAIGITIDYDVGEMYWMVLNINGDVLLFKTKVDSMLTIVRVNKALSSVRGM